MYIPYGNYPKDFSLNSINDNPVLFKKVDFRDFLTKLPSDKQQAFMKSEIFMVCSLYQENAMTSLIMLLSAIECSVNPEHKPLESELGSKSFKKKILESTGGEEALKLLHDVLDKNAQLYTSRRSIIGFFMNNLTNKEKMRIIVGINLIHKYKKTTVNPGIKSSSRLGQFVALYTPIPEPSPHFDINDTKSIDDALSLRVKGVIFDIRNGFIHRASFSPFGDEKFMAENIKLDHEKWKGGDPKESWLITMNFKDLHSLAHIAFQNYWLKEYESIAN